MAEVGTVAITGLHAEDRARWTELWSGYLAFYKTSLPAEVFEQTWARVLQDEDLHGLAARLDGRVVGLTHFLFHRSAWTVGPVCYLQDLFVEDTARGHGTGRALIEAVADHARSKRSERLYWLTETDNATARQIYDRLAKNSGFIRYNYTL